jgi:3-oxoacyl-[acyl-carrier protein] reductase
MSGGAEQSRVVLVSGGSRGLGAGLVQAFLECGHRVATFSRSATDRTRGWSTDPAIRDRFHFAEVDATDRAGTRALVDAVGERWGGIEVLVNNAGIAIDGLLPLLQDDDIDRLVDVDLKSVIFLTKRVLRPMLLRDWGRIINISSVVGISGYRGLSVYGATKAALDGFTRGLAREVGVRGITVNSVAPGYLRTEMTHGLESEQMEQIVRRTPVGRLGEVEDVAAMVLFLASERANFITGQTLVVDGGITA